MICLFLVGEGGKEERIEELQEENQEELESFLVIFAGFSTLFAKQNKSNPKI